MANLSEEIMIRRYEFFSWRGFVVGAAIITMSMILQSLVAYPLIWSDRPVSYALLVAVSAVVVGAASGGVLVFLYPPEQDIIGVAGLGSDNASQHLALLLVLMALMQPMLSGFVFFFDYFGPFGNDPLVVIWVLVAFGAPSAGLSVAMFDRTNAIALDLQLYFQHQNKLDMVRLDWLHGLGPRTAAYRMGMLERAAEKVRGLRVRGHEIIREKDALPVSTAENE